MPIKKEWEDVTRKCPHCGKIHVGTVYRETYYGKSYKCTGCGAEFAASISEKEKFDEYRVARIRVEHILARPGIFNMPCSQCGADASRLMVYSDINGIGYQCSKCHNKFSHASLNAAWDGLTQLEENYPIEISRDPIYAYMWAILWTKNFKCWNENVESHINGINNRIAHPDDQAKVNEYAASLDEMIANNQIQELLKAGKIKKCPKCGNCYINKNDNMCDDCRQRIEKERTEKDAEKRRKQAERSTPEAKKKRKAKATAISVIAGILAVAIAILAVIYCIMPEWLFGTCTVEYYLDGVKNTREVALNSEFSINKPSRTGYRFAGFYLDEECTQQVVGKDGKSVEDLDVSYKGAVVSLYPKWEPIEYTIRLNASGGKDGAITSIKVLYGNDLSNLPTDATKTGYSLVGWKDANDKIVAGSDGVVFEERKTFYDSNYAIPSDEASEIVFYAIWEANTYTATLDVNGGDAMANNTFGITFDSTATLPIPTRTGFDFVGWYIESQQITGNDGKLIGVWNKANNGTTLRAEWAIRTYNIVHTAGKGGATSGATSATYGSTVTLTATTNVGYTFDGWYVAGVKQGTETTYTFTIGAGDVTVEARWTANGYTATLNVNGGDELAINQATVVYDTKHQFAVPTRTGYDFVGWYVDDTQVTDKNGKAIIPWSYANNDTTLFAEWEIKKYDISAVINPTTGGVVNGSILVEYGSDTKLTVATNPGYTFDGWYISGSKVGDANSYTISNVTEDYTIEARWTANTYTATLDVNGGDSLVETQKTVTFDASYQLPVPTRTGYTFNGWYDGTTKVTNSNGTPIDVWGYTSDKTLTAKWTANTYTISFANCDNINSANVTYGTTYTLPTPTNNRKYDTFAGWAYGGSTYTSSITMPAKDITMSATWNSNGWTYISTKSEMQNIQSNLSGKYCLLNDINLGSGWTPIGQNNWTEFTSPSKYFTGHFDGNGKTINYEINQGSFDNDKTYSFGLFGTILGATIENLNVKANIMLVKSSGNGSTGCYAGGITGWTKNSSIIKCSASGNIKQVDSGSEGYGVIRTGGIAGKSYNTYFKSNTNKASLYSSGFNAFTGGIAGGYDSWTTSFGESSGNSNSGSCDATHGSWVYGHSDKNNLGVLFIPRTNNVPINCGHFGCYYIYEKTNE